MSEQRRTSTLGRETVYFESLQSTMDLSSDELSKSIYDMVEGF